MLIPFKDVNRTFSISNKKITDCNFSTRTENDLLAIEVSTVSQLIFLTQNEFLYFPNIGRKCLNEIREFLQENNLQFADILKRRIRDCDFPKKIKKCLESINIEFVEEILTFNERELLKIPLFGMGSINELNKFLDKHHLKLGLTNIDETKNDLQLTLSSLDWASKPVVELWLELYLPILGDDNPTIKRALHFLDRITRKQFLKDGEKESLNNVN